MCPVIHMSRYSQNVPLFTVEYNVVMTYCRAFHKANLRGGVDPPPSCFDGGGRIGKKHLRGGWGGGTGTRQPIMLLRSINITHLSIFRAYIHSSPCIVHVLRVKLKLLVGRFLAAASKCKKIRVNWIFLCPHPLPYIV